MTARIVYMGTPAFACPALEGLAAMPGVEVVLTVTQPDRPSGRGRKLQSPPVKTVADQLGLPVYQAGSLRTAEARQPIVDAQPDLIVVAAFGLILGSSILALPKRGCVNLHASLLPAYRGASPIAAAILNGEAETGVTLMRMERGLDTGPMYAQRRLSIAGDDTTESLTERLSYVAAALMLSSLLTVADGSLTPTPQPGGATLTRPLVKADGWIDWQRPVVNVERHIRAMWSWPRAWTTLPDGSVLQIHRSRSESGVPTVSPGQVVLDMEGFRVACADGWLRIDVAQLPGGRPLSGAQLASGKGISDGLILGGRDRPHVPGPLVRAVEEG